MLDKLLNMFAFLEEWFPEGVDLSILNPIVKLIGLEGNPEAGQLLVIASFFSLLLIFYFLVRATEKKTKAKPEVKEKEKKEERSVDEIEIQLELAVDKIEVKAGDPEEITEPDALPYVVKETIFVPESEAIAKLEPEVVVEPEPAEEAEEELTKEGLFARLKTRLSKTKQGFFGQLDGLLSGRKINDELFEELEEALVQADLGVKTSYALLASLQEQAQRGELKDGNALKDKLRESIQQILKSQVAPMDIKSAKPYVLLVCGVNGVGKTTTIGKLAKRFTDQGLSTMMVAADTFRAAAMEQLEIWAKRVGADFIKQQSGADPSAVAYDGIAAAKSRGTDVVIVDTAGRLHTKANLMEELKKVKRVIKKLMPDAPHQTLLVLDATTGQNAIAQAKQFHESLGLTGVILTKLDGTAKGGVIVGISDELKLPIPFIGIGERLDDLREFNPDEFVEALFTAND